MTEEKGLAYQLTKLLEFFVPCVEESAESRRGVAELGESLRKDYLEFISQQGPWKYAFGKPNSITGLSSHYFPCAPPVPLPSKGSRSP
jgi:hypothetical protein